MCMRWCCRIFYLAISASKLSQCAKYECTGVATFFSWSFLHPNCQSAPNVNAPVFPHFLPGHFCARIVRVHQIGMHWCCHIFVPGHLHAQIVRVHPMWMRQCCHIFYLAISALKLSQCAQYECAGVAAFSSGLFLCPNFQSGPNVNSLVLLHVLVGYFCS